MRAVLQRVTAASVRVEDETKGHIGPGLLVLLGITQEDSGEDIEKLAAKIAALRIFSDEAGLMNRSLTDSGGDLLVISQFTLYASTRRGNRPSYERAARPAEAEELYERFLRVAEKTLGKPVQRGVFGADMQVSLVNDGPVTILLDTKDRDL